MTDIRFSELPLDPSLDHEGVEGHVKLWRAVLDQAFDDILEYKRKAEQAELQEDNASRVYWSAYKRALNWFRGIRSPLEVYRNTEPGVHVVCDLAQINYITVRRAVRTKLEKEGIEL